MHLRALNSLLLANLTESHLCIDGSAKTTDPEVPVASEVKKLVEVGDKGQSAADSKGSHSSCNGCSKSSHVKLCWV